MATTALDHAHAPAHAHPKAGLWSWITTVDHKRIGILYGTTAFLFFLIGGLEALLLRVQLGTAENTFLSPELYNQLFTMHGTTMIFLGVMPLNAMFFNYLIPIQLGARDVAFPRLNAFSYWVFLFGGLFINASFLFNAAPNAGWFGYANLTSTEFSPGLNTDFWVIGLQILGISSLAAAVNFFVTVVNLRAPGMKLMRMPMFVWMSFITQVLILLAFPVITVALILLMMDRFVGAAFFVPAGGGDPMLWQHLFWIFGHPEVYILILPAFGIVSEILPVFSRKPLFGYAAMVFSGAFIAFLGFGVWSHHMFSTGMGPIADTVFAPHHDADRHPHGGEDLQLDRHPVGRLAAAEDAALLRPGLHRDVHRGRPLRRDARLAPGRPAADRHLLRGGALPLRALRRRHLRPDRRGVLLDARRCRAGCSPRRLGKLHFWMMFVGFNLTFFPMHLVGLHGMPRRVYTYPAGLGFEVLNQLETAGSFLLAASFLVFGWNLWRNVLRGRGAPATADPWNGATLEWSIPSPPQEFNFAEVPQVESRDALWEMKRERGGALPEPQRVSGAGIHMPNPSHWPFVCALGVLVFFVGLMFPLGGTTQLAVSIGGGLLTMFAMYRWAFEPAG